MKAVLCLFFACATIWAQGTAQINGTIKDASGSAIPGAEVKITQTATGAVRTATSGADGTYVLTNLPIGPYMLEVSKEGFSKYVQSGIVLQVDSNPTIDAAMKIGTVNEEVTVQADAAMVETHSTGIGQVVDNQRVVEMPLNGRNATELVFLAGMANIGGANGGFLNSVRNYPTVMISVAGGVANQQQYTLDGANHNDAYNGLNLPLPFPDALQEFKVESSALPAQYGMHSSAAVNAVTKSGTNAYHGNAFEFFRNGDLNARDFFAPTRDTLKRNQFGGTIGGPVLPRFRDKLFFFAGYQGTILKSDGTQNIAYVPTPAELQGDFTVAASTACNARAITLPASSGFVDNKIPVSRLNPASLKIDSYLPVPADTACGKVNYGLLSNSTENMGVARIDWQKSEKHTFFARYYETNLDSPSTFDGHNALTLNSNFAHDRVYSLSLGDTYLFSASVVNAFHLGANRTAIPKIVDNFATWPQLGVNAPYNPAPSPRVQVTGNGFNIGSGNSIINHDMTGPNPNLADDISWVKGDHQFGFGGNYLRTSINYESGINATGLPTFNGSITGLSMADFLTGQPATWTQGNISYFYNRQTYIGLYAQDAWKVTSHLTINYGVRWEPFFPIRSKYGLFARFDQNLFNQNVHSIVHVNAPAGLIFPGDPQWTSGNSIANMRFNEFTPRFGLVWDPKGDGKMTIRAAFGSYTDRSGLYALSSFGQDAPIGNVVTVNNPPDFSNPWATYPGGNPLPILLSRDEQFPLNGAYITYPSDWKPLWVNQWNLSVQRQFGSDWLITANYLGNNTFHLVTEDQINASQFLGTGSCTINGPNGPVTYSTCGTVATNSQRRPLYLQNPAQGQYYGIVSVGSPEGTGSYNALYLSTQKRMSHGTNVLANYTWSHCISDLWNGQPGNNGVSAVTPLNRRADRGNCAPNLVSSDQRHVFNLSVVAQTPKFSSRALSLIASQWQFSPILKIKSAQFFTVTSGTDVALNGQGSQRPNLVGNPYPSNQNVNSWISSTAFATPATGTLGNLGIGNLKGPGVVQLDLAVSRTFPVREKQTIQLRAEAFNLPNHLNPFTPVATLNSGAFGKIQQDISGTSGLSAGDYRVIQFALKYAF
jgi:hypothetical protein